MYSGTEIFATFKCCTVILLLIFNVASGTDLEIEGKTTLRDSSILTYQPTWDSLDSRPLPAWYDESKVGIFIHWGVYSVPAFGSEWFWRSWNVGRENVSEFMEANYKPNFTYQNFAPEFTAEFFDPQRWVNLFKKSGAKYIVLTSKHHEGYTLWPSKHSFSWNALDVGPKRDLVGDLAKVVRENSDLYFGLYHSLYEWYNPLWLQDQANKFQTDQFIQHKILPEMFELVETYKPDVLWSDGEWDASDNYWKSKEFLAWLYNESPVKDNVVVNDRWGDNTLCKHGGFYTCTDRYNPGTLQPHKWENCFTLDRLSWGYRRNADLSGYLTIQEVISTIVETVACRGNVLVNVGPTKEGIIPPIMEERLIQMGYWLNTNGEAIYKTVPWLFQNDTVTPRVWYTQKPNENKIFAIMLTWPGETIHLGAVDYAIVSSIRILGHSSNINFRGDQRQGIIIEMPRSDLIDSRWAWTAEIITTSSVTTESGTTTTVTTGRTTTTTASGCTYPFHSAPSLISFMIFLYSSILIFR